jgi:hypothetical protein
MGYIMLDDRRYDFSLETNLKERLWEQVREKSKQASAGAGVKREAVSFESLSGKPKETHKAAAERSTVCKDLGKSK